MDEHTRPHYERSALLTIDLQHDFVSTVGGTREVLPAVRVLVGGYRAAGLPIVHVVRLYLPDGSNADLSRRSLLASGGSVASPGSTGSQLAEGLVPHAGTELDSVRLLAGELQPLGPAEHVLFKPRWNAFYGTALDDHLHRLGVDTVVVAGCNYPNCPRGTLFGASERDYRAVLVSDAVSQYTDRADAELRSIGVLPTTSGDVLAHVSDAVDIVTAPPPR